MFYLKKTEIQGFPRSPNLDNLTTYVMGFNILEAIPPTMMAKMTSKAAKTEAFIHPKLPLARLSIKARQGMYVMVTRARTINWFGDITAAKSAVWNITNIISMAAA